MFQNLPDVKRLCTIFGQASPTASLSLRLCTPGRVGARGPHADKQREAEADPDLGIVIEVIYVGLRLQGRVLGNVVDNDTILQNRRCLEPPLL